MKRQEIETQVNEIIVAVLGIKPELIKDEADIQADLGADSLDFVEILIQCEHTFNVKVEDDLLDDIHTVKDIYDLACKLV